MPRPLVVKQVGDFIWSILPSDPSHALILIGSTFLFISDRLRWWPDFHLPWAWHVRFFAFPLVLAGAAGYYLCFVPCGRPLRRLLDAVLLPAFIGLIGIPIVGLTWYRDAIKPQRAALLSILNHQPWNLRDLLDVAEVLGPAIQFATIGFTSVAIFFVLLAMGRTTLPIRLPNVFDSTSGCSDYQGEHRRTMLFVWAMIAPVVLIYLPSFIIGTALTLTRVAALRPGGSDYEWVSTIVVDLTLLVLIWFAIGNEGRREISEMFRIPPPLFLALAGLIPAAITNMLPLAIYFDERISRSSQGGGKWAPPELANYLSFPGIASLYLIFPALVEEIAWRGFLQPRFIRRYGLFRGIFLVGLVWGAFHFSWDFNWTMTSAYVLYRLSIRVIGTVILSFVLAWLTISSKSILPAALAHAAYNAFLETGQHYSLLATWWFKDLLWAVAGYLLWHFFSPGSTDLPPQPDLLRELQPNPSGV